MKVNPKTGFLGGSKSTKIASENGFVTGPTAGVAKPARPGQPVSKGKVAYENAGKVETITPPDSE